MSHHLDSPLARQDPRLDISDVYLFDAPAATVLIMNVNPLSGSGGFHPEGRYEFRIDTDGDALEDRSYVFTFGESDEDGEQDFLAMRNDGPAARRRDGGGSVFARGSTGRVTDGADGARIWAGRAADPFFTCGAVVGAVQEAVAHGTPVDLGKIDYGAAENAFAGTNVQAIVMEIPDSSFDVPEIGFWGTTALATDDGGWRQINRCATPFVNSIFSLDDPDWASEYNLGHPSTDRSAYGPLVCDLVAQAVAAGGTCADPRGHAQRVVDTIFPDVLRYRIGSPANFGFTIRNGRGLTECVPEVMFSLVLDKAVPLGIDAGSSTGVPRTNFPYLAPPL